MNKIIIIMNNKFNFFIIIVVIIIHLFNSSYYISFINVTIITFFLYLINFLKALSMVVKKANQFPKTVQNVLFGDRITKLEVKSKI